MRKLVFQLFIIIAAGAALASCAPRKVNYEQRNIFEITAASVSLSGNVDPALGPELQRRLDASIEISHRGSPVRSAYLDVGVLSVNGRRGLGDKSNSARVQVIARDPQTNEPLYLTDFEANSFAGSKAFAAASLAEAIAAHIRIEFALATPSPNAIRPEIEISTRLKNEEWAPTGTARAYQPQESGDVLLNANTRFSSDGEISTANEDRPKQDGPVRLYVDEKTGRLTELKPREDEGDLAEGFDNDEPCVVTTDNDCASSLLRQ